MNWNTITEFNDGKFNRTPINDYVYLPGYVNNENHPFALCKSLTHVNELTRYPDNRYCMGDGPDELKKNLNKAPPNWKYKTKEVRYNVNNSGYRTKEWKDIDWKNSVVIFGCSCTFGVGLAEDETISYHLEQQLGRPVINLGCPSGSNNLILNNSATCIEKFGVPWAVVMNWTTTNRFRYYAKNEYVDLGPWQHSEKNRMVNDVNVSKLWLDFYYDVYNENTTNYYISKSAKAIWEDRTRYCTISYFDQSAHVMRADKFFYINPDDRARDLIHPGETNSIEVATYLAERLK